jgi:hypothetical protein
VGEQNKMVSWETETWIVFASATLQQSAGFSSSSLLPSRPCGSFAILDWSLKHTKPFDTVGWICFRLGFHAWPSIFRTFLNILIVFSHLPVEDPHIQNSGKWKGLSLWRLWTLLLSWVV